VPPENVARWKFTRPPENVAPPKSTRQVEQAVRVGALDELRFVGRHRGGRAVHQLEVEAQQLRQLAERLPPQDVPTDAPRPLMDLGPQVDRQVPPR
jgi:hypothetical protein